MGWLDGIIDSVDINVSTLGDSEVQGSLACCSPWGHKESDTTEGLNNNNNHHHQKTGGCDSADTWGVDFWPPELTQYFLVI